MRIYDTNRSVKDADEMFLRVTASNIVHAVRRLSSTIGKLYFQGIFTNEFDDLLDAEYLANRPEDLKMCNFLISLNEARAWHAVL